MTESDKAQMRECSIQVRQALTADLPSITDKEIEDSLWHYYYDVEKSVAYLRSKSFSLDTMQETDLELADQYAPKKPKKPKGPAPVNKKANGGSYFLFFSIRALQ